MEEKKQSIVAATLGYGVILGILVIVFSLILFLLNVKPGSKLENLSYLIIIAGIIIAQITFRNKQENGLLSYGKSFTVGMLTIIFASILIGIWTFIFFRYVDPGAIETMRQTAEQKLMDRGMSDAEIDQSMKWVEMFQKPGILTFFAVFFNILIGIVISLISAIFTKKEIQSPMPKV